MMLQEIQAEYNALTADALAAWSAHADPGALVAADPRRGRLGVTSGRLISFNPALLALHDEIAALARADALLAPVPRASLHFTFLALAWDHYDSPAGLPPAIAEARARFVEHVSGLNFAVHALRLVPLRNSLVLAGMPDAASLAARARLTDALLATAWRPLLEERYARLPLPPRLWHSTLVRYGRQFAPQSLRAFYHAHAGRNLGGIELGEPHLLMADAMWSVRLRL
jgi:hypothetical protein